MNASRDPGLFFSALALFLIASAIISLGFGSAGIGVGEALRVVVGKVFVGSNPDTAVRSTEETIVLQVRLPRTILAILVGALLALSGVIMQAFFRNVMAEPYLVGVSSGGALGAVLAMQCGWSFRAGPFSTLPLSAFVFALAVVGLVYLINSRRLGLHTTGLLLSGIAIASAISAVVALLLITSERSVQQVLLWLLGSLATARWEHVVIVLPYVIVGFLAAAYFARDLDLLLWGDVTSAALGVPIARTRGYLLAIASFMAAAAVAVSGVIGFVGLMVPHIARTLIGTRHRMLIPAVALLGGALLLWADVLARTLWAPAELPLGAITAIVGAPFLVYLCTRGERVRL